MIGEGFSVAELFEATEINGMQLKNRFVRSATWTGMADSGGNCTQRLVDFLVELARGGVGLISTGHAYVLKNGQAGPRQLAIDNDAVIPGLRLLTSAIHNCGARIVMQLSHAGIYADPELTGHTPVAVSAGGTFVAYPVQELSAEAIEGVVEAFVMAAARAKRAGFDGIQLHAGHGYLLNQFLSRAYNHRTDQYGGGVADRAFPLLQIVRRIRGVVGPLYPILVKLNSADYLENGITLDESLQIGRLLESDGVDALEITGGTRESGRFKSTRTGIVSDADEAYFEAAARTFRQQQNIPIIQVGGIRRYATAVRLLASGAADYIAMSRPFINQPDLINRWESAQTHSFGCRSENDCLIFGLSGDGIKCQWPRR